MNQSRLYVPNPQKWIDYFKYNKPQVGKGFVTSQKSAPESSVSINSVSPSEQTVNQAKSELKRDGIKASEVSSLAQKLVKPLEETQIVNRKGLQPKETRKKVLTTTKKTRKNNTKGYNAVKKHKKKTRKGLKIIEHKYPKTDRKLQKHISTWDIFGN